MPDQIDRLEYLSTKLMDGALSEEESAELSEMLLASPEMRAEFYSSVNTDSLLADGYGCEEAAAKSAKPTKRKPPRSRAKPKTRRFPVLLLSTAAIVAICIAAYFIFRPRPIMTIELAQRTAIRRSGFNPFARAKALYNGDTVTVGDGGQAILTTHANDRLQVIGGSITVTQDGRGYQFIRRGGFLDATVSPGLNRSIEFQTKSGTVSVTGTRFSLIDPGEQTLVALHEGSLQVAAKQGTAQELSPGNSALLRPGKAPLVQKIPVPVWRFPGNAEGAAHSAHPLTEKLKPDRSVSVSAWIRLTKFAQYGGIAGCLWDTGSRESGYGLTLGPKPGTVDFIAFTGKDTVGHGTDWPAARAKAGEGWRHICGVYDGRSLRLYIDGKLAANRPTRGNIDYKYAKDFKVGRFSDDSEDRLFPGDIRQVMVFRKALSQTQVEFLYTSTHPYQESK